MGPSGLQLLKVPVLPLSSLSSESPLAIHSYLPPPEETVYGLPRRLSGKEPASQRRRHEFDPWIRKIPWRREMVMHSSILAWTDSHGQRRTWRPTVRECPQESDTTTQWLNNNLNRNSAQGKHHPLPSALDHTPAAHLEGKGLGVPFCHRPVPCDGSSGLRPGLHSARRQDHRLCRS